MSRAALLGALLVLGAGLIAPAAVAPSHPDEVPTSRDDVLPPAVANVTQDPWRPRRGDDVAVYVTLRDGWTDPQAVLLRFCRVQPDYSCWPTSLRMRPVGDADAPSPEWAAVIPWEAKFMRADTLHVGYNLSLVYANGSAFEAPTGNYNAPPDFPVESGGRYFFYRLSAETRPLDATSATPFLIALVVLGGAGLAYRARRRRRAPPRDRRPDGPGGANPGGRDGGS